MGVRLKRLKMVSTYIWVDTIASSDGVRKVCCPDGYRRACYDASALRASVRDVRIPIRRKMSHHSQRCSQTGGPL
ncbi:hypothetical protein CVE34_01210 [Pseudomonas syringae pv. actinidiae]|nr:hypothetical protein [Pseudomonas syringae pv. actinidiae]NAS70183.1 hypothetical protein [Pseudomonas syringae pv. actinidiae]NAS75956.1 hypothetical protein [Pseudomonas syringae pv. actinidiae]NAT00385.1 hypothetical protein [Pseudomonas syringae pv. actinidiae]NAT05896.1 hypothetical protein [Pseudomonas syringae pv. actinidiae]